MRSRRSPNSGWTLSALTMVAVLMAAPAVAAAATRYAEAGGDGNPAVCAQADPCAIEPAVEDASVANGDEIVVAPGTYDLGTGVLAVNRDIDLHGAAGAPKPVITTASTTTFDAAVQVGFTGSGSTISDLELVNTSGSINTYAVSSNPTSPVTFERIVARGNSPGFICNPINATMRDSLCANSGSGAALGIAIGGFPGSSLTTNLRNVTAASTSGVGIDLGVIQIDYTIDAKNVIALGGGVADVRAGENSGGLGGNATIDFAYSNYDTTNAGAGTSITAPGAGTGNQTSAPSFVNPATGNYRQVFGSPTIDAGGTVDLLGTLDFEGDLRSIDGDCGAGAQPDIGADEFDGPFAENDDFSEAQVITGATASIPGTTRCATREDPAEPDHCVVDEDPICEFTWIGDHSVWYRWTAPASGPATVDTCVAEIDSILAVYTGSALDSLTRVIDDNNNCPTGFGSKVEFQASAGTTYHLAVGDAGGARQADFTLALAGTEPPPDPPPPDPPPSQDTDPPETEITESPPNKTEKSKAKYRFSSDEPGASFECSLKGKRLKKSVKRFGDCDSPRKYKRLKQGKYRFKVRAVDTAGNVDPSPAKDRFKVVG